MPKLSSLQGCVNLTAMASPTARQSPTLNTTKQDSQRAQLQRYFLDYLYEPPQLIIAQSNARARTRVGARTHNLLPSLEPLVTIILHISSLVSNGIFYTDDQCQWR